MESSEVVLSEGSKPQASGEGRRLKAWESLRRVNYNSLDRFCSVAAARVERGCTEHLIKTSLMSSCPPGRDICIHIRIGATPVGTEKDPDKLIPQAFVRGYYRSAQTTPCRRRLILGTPDG